MHKDWRAEFERYIEAHSQMRGIAPEIIHQLHGGHEREVSLTISLLREALAAYEQAVEAFEATRAEVLRLREAVPRETLRLAAAYEAQGNPSSAKVARQAATVALIVLNGSEAQLAPPPEGGQE